MLSPRDPNLLALILQVRQDYDPHSVEAELTSDLCGDAMDAHQAQLQTTATAAPPDDRQVTFNADMLASVLLTMRDDLAETKRLLQRVFEILGERSA
jgi:hypothetical protein